MFSFGGLLTTAVEWYKAKIKWNIIVGYNAAVGKSPEGKRVKFIKPGSLIISSQNYWVNNSQKIQKIKFMLKS